MDCGTQAWASLLEGPRCRGVWLQGVGWALRPARPGPGRPPWRRAGHAVCVYPMSPSRAWAPLCAPSPAGG